MGLGRFADARALLKQAADLQLEFIGARRLSYLLAFIEGDRATMARELDASIGLRETNAAFGWQARTSAFHGRIQAAHEQFRRGIQMAGQGNFEEVAARLGMEDAETHALVGQCAVAREEVSSGLKASQDNVTLERAARALALCGAEREASALASELARRFPEATLTTHVWLPVIDAVLAERRGDAAHAVEALEPVRPYDHAPSAEFWPAYIRGQAYLELKDGRAAAAEFRAILDHRGEVPASVLYPLSHLGHARAARFTNDTPTSNRAYEEFLRLWNAADPDLQALAAARREHPQP